MPATATTFGYPATRIGETAHWLVLLRPKQVTLGSLVLLCKEPATAFGSLSDAAFADQARAVRAIEAMLSAFCGYDRINYLMLMMVDPDVHYHVIPRYETPRSHEGLTIADTGWPGPPALADAAALDEASLAGLAAALRPLWDDAMRAHGDGRGA